MVNSLGRQLDGIRKRRHPYKAQYMHPDDLAALTIAPDARVRVEADATMRPKAVPVSHCWGGLPDANVPFTA